ncbi:MAG: hypothetical protein Q9216_000297 [Gyalolechia sp. 2 TL-2023]
MGEDDPTVPLLKSASAKGATAVSRTANLFSDWWLWELAEACTSIFAVLINSVVSLLSAIGKLCIVSAVSSAINQAKWLWYRQGSSRPLQDLQLFNDAGGGPWGAVQLIHLAFLGAIVVVLVNFFDPFLQQALFYESRSVPSDNVPTIVRSQVYAARSEEGLPLPSLVDLSMKAAVYNGVFNIQNNADNGVSHTCSTGHCSWQNFSSLAVCSRCVNITSSLEKHCTQGKCDWLGLPNGPILSGSGGQINSSVTNISSELHGIEPSVLRFSSLVSNNVSDSDRALAFECSMFYCVGKFAAFVTDGTVDQRMLGSWRNDSARYNNTSDLVLRPPVGFTNQTNRTTTFKVSQIAAAAINSFMTSMFTGSGGVNNSGSVFSSDIMQALYDTSNLTQRIDNLATSMTNNIRGQDDHVSGPAYGIAWKKETYLHVRWAWFAFPASLVLISAIFLLGTIFETSYRDVLVWKSSDLALLFHGRGLNLSSPSERPVNKLSSMNTRAKNVKAELLETPEGGWKLTQDEE